MNDHVTLYRKDQCPDRAWEAASQALGELKQLAPMWMHEIIVGWDGDSDKALESETDLSYRQGTVWFTGNWLGADETDRRHYLVHEMMHFHVRTIVDAAEQAIKAAPEEAREGLVEMVRVAHEGAVCDLSKLVEELRKD